MLYMMPLSRHALSLQTRLHRRFILGTVIVPTTVMKASAQRESGALVSFMMACPLSKIFRVVLSATPFCLGVCGTVNSSLIPFSAQYFLRGGVMYSPPRSE